MLTFGDKYPPDRPFKRPAPDSTRQRIQRAVRAARQGQAAVIQIELFRGTYAVAIIPHDDCWCCKVADGGRWVMKYRLGVPSYGVARMTISALATQLGPNDVFAM